MPDVPITMLPAVTLADAITSAADTLADALRTVGKGAPQIARDDDFPCCANGGHGLELGGGATRRDADGAPTHLEVLDRVRSWRRQGVEFSTILAAVERARQIEAHG